MRDSILRESASHVTDMQSDCEECCPDPGSQALDNTPSESDSNVDSAVPRRETEVPSTAININLDELSELAKLAEIKTTMKFIQALETASLTTTRVLILRPLNASETLRNIPLISLTLIYAFRLISLFPSKTPCRRRICLLAEQLCAVTQKTRYLRTTKSSIAWHSSAEFFPSF